MKSYVTFGSAGTSKWGGDLIKSEWTYTVYCVNFALIKKCARQAAAFGAPARNKTNCPVASCRITIFANITMKLLVTY